MINSLSFEPECIKERHRIEFKSPQSIFLIILNQRTCRSASYVWNFLTLNARIFLILKLYRKYHVNVVVPPVPNQPKTFRFPPCTFGVKKPEKRSFQPSWFDNRPWLHYDVAKDLAFCHLCMLAYRDGSRPRWLSWMRRPTGDQEVAGSTPTEVGNILSWRLIMKYFLRSFSPFRSKWNDTDYGPVETQKHCSEYQKLGVLFHHGWWNHRCIKSQTVRAGFETRGRETGSSRRVHWIVQSWFAVPDLDFFL